MNPNDSPAGRPLRAPTHQQIAALAHELWQERGCPEGSDVDIWLEAERQLNGAPPSPATHRDPIPADPDAVTPDEDPALNPSEDRAINQAAPGGGQVRSATSFDVRTQL